MQGLDTSRMHHPSGFLLPFEKDKAFKFFQVTKVLGKSLKNTSTYVPVQADEL